MGERVKGKMDNSAEIKEEKPVTKPPADNSTDHIIIKVWFQDNTEVCVSIKKSAPLQKLMNLCAKRKSMDVQMFRFLFDGDRINGEQTPDEVGLSDGDQIDAMLEQIAG